MARTRDLKLIRYAEAADRLGVSTRTVRRMICRGLLEQCQAPGTTGNGGVRVSQRSVDELLREELKAAARHATSLRRGRTISLREWRALG